MPLNPENPSDIKKLYSAMEHSRNRMGPFRRNRIAALMQYAGKNYGPNTDDHGMDRIPVNKIEQMVDIFGRQIAANNPAALVTTFHKQLIPAAASFQIRLNRIVQELMLVEALRESVTDAIFCLGVIRTGSSVVNPTQSGFTTEEGGPYARSVSLDDLVVDMQAHRFDQVDFIGNRYSLPIDDLRESGFYDDDQLDQLITSHPNEPGGLDGFGAEERDLSISLGSGVEYGEYRKYVELWDVWLPSSNVIVTLPDRGAQKALRVAPFDGPEGGPYHLLSFGNVPGNLMPKSLAMAAMDLHYFINRIYRKIFRQAERQKEVPWYQGEAAEDMQRLMEAGDGQVVRVDHAAGTGSFKSGGANPQSIAIALHADRLFSKQLSNMDLIGGLASGADTLGETELLSASSNKLIADMQDKFVRFTTQIMQHLAWYEWTEPLRESVIAKDFGVRELWAPETREGDFIQYDIKIEPFSMQRQSPATKLRSLLQIYQQVLAPAAPMMNQQGLGIDWNKFMNLLQRYSNLPELGQILTPLTEDEMSRSRTADDKPQKAAVTERINTRVSRGSAGDADSEFMTRMLNATEAQVA